MNYRGADIEQLASTSAYFATLRRRRHQARSPPDSHFIVFPPNICDPVRAFGLYYRYALKLPVRRHQARVDFSDLVYLAGYLLIPECVLRQLVTKFYILPDRNAEIFIDALYHLCTIEYYDFNCFYMSLLGLPIGILFLCQPATRQYVQNVMRCLIASFQENYPRHPTSHLFPPVTCPSTIYCLYPGHNYLRQRLRLFCCRPRIFRACLCFGR